MFQEPGGDRARRSHVAECPGDCAASCHPPRRNFRETACDRLCEVRVHERVLRQARKTFLRKGPSTVLRVLFSFEAAWLSRKTLSDGWFPATSSWRKDASPRWVPETDPRRRYSTARVVRSSRDSSTSTTTSRTHSFAAWPTTCPWRRCCRGPPQSMRSSLGGTSRSARCSVASKCSGPARRASTT